LRSPIGVVMVMFQFPSTAILRLLEWCCAEPEWSWHLDRLGRRYNPSRRASPMA
jgi:hypothetical protein